MSTSMPMPAVNSPLPSGMKVMLGAFWSFCHSLITKASFTDRHTISSTPTFLNVDASSL